MAKKPVMMGSAAATARMMAAWRRAGGRGSPTNASLGPAPAAPAPPSAPKLVAPYLTADDLMNINATSSDYATKLANIDFDLNNLGLDTTYQKTQTDNAAKAQTSSAADAMAARGLFRSSVKDAALYDIEASRALQDKYLDDKLTTATLNAGTQKKTLADSKTRFDTSIDAKKVENAQGVNDPLSAAWADAMASYNAKYPTPAAPAAPAAPKPPAAAGAAKPVMLGTSAGTAAMMAAWRAAGGQGTPTKVTLPKPPKPPRPPRPPRPGNQAQGRGYV